MSGQILEIDYDSKKNRGLIKPGSALDTIREIFSIENVAARFVKTFQPKRIYAITPLGSFDIGLVGEIERVIAAKQLPITIQLSPSARAILQPAITVSLVDGLTKPLRDYQVVATSRCFEQGRGVVVMGTGAGKTLTIASLIQNFFYNSKNQEFFKCLIVVPDLGLVRQTYDDFAEYGVDLTVTKWTGNSEPDLTCNIVIANTAIIQRQVDTCDWINDVDLLIVDEVHKLNTRSGLSKIVHKISTPHKFGFTGTLPENKIDAWNVIGKIGPVLFEKSSYELRSENFLTNVSVKMLQLTYIDKPVRIKDRNFATEQYQEELEFIKVNNFRNRVIRTTCNNFNNNILILVNHIEHGEMLFNILNTLSGKHVFFIQGEVEIDERERVKQIMESSDNVICVAISAIFSTGVNIKNIHMILFAAGGKSFIRTVQSIGRGLRQNDNKDKLIIIDIADNLEYGNKHATKRIEIYKSEKIPYNIHNLIEKVS